MAAPETRDGLDEPDDHQGQQPLSCSALLRSSPILRAALVVWLLIVGIVSIRCFIKPRANSVYPIFSAAAQRWLAGSDLYGTEGEPYRYSPVVTAFFIPLSTLPDRVSGALWRLLNSFVYLTAFMWWCRVVLPRSLTVNHLGLLLLLIVPLSIGSLNNGQSNALVLGLLLAGVAAAATERLTLSAGCVALACLFKLYPIAIGLLLSVVLGRRFATRLAIALTIGLAVPFLLQRPDYVVAQYAGWIEHLRSDDRQLLSADLWYRDIRLLLHTCDLNLSGKIYPWLQLLVGAGIAGLCLTVRRRAQDQRALLTAMFALGTCWMTLFGSATESSTYILLAPSLAWAVVDVLTEARPHWQRVGLLASFVLFTITQAAVWAPGGGRPFHALGTHALAALLFFLCQLASMVFSLPAPSDKLGTYPSLSAQMGQAVLGIRKNRGLNPISLVDRKGGV